MRTTASILLPACLATLLALGGCGGSRPAPSPPLPATPYAEREFRAAWVATVANIDWPSSPGLPGDAQQAEALRILDTAARLGLNAIILQVRPQCDALYESTIEPWSLFLTGTEGSPPSPPYDPLSFWVEEAHNRGLELHAWFNPYRARAQRGGAISEGSIIRRKPGLAKEIPNGMWWLNPTNPEVQEYSLSVVIDVLQRYDIDGIHFDDYFYPYGDGGFPDDDTWAAYEAEGGSLSREDWRREAVNTFVRRVHEGIRTTKPHVKFGISPFGIWRPGHPPSIEGFDQYAMLYADARLWLREGWVDYWNPQLYWPIGRVAQSFPVLLGWWSGENSRNRHIWPGLFTSRMTDSKGEVETVNQVMTVRGFQPASPGHVHFSMRALMGDSTGIRTALLSGPYRRQALVPPSPWLSDSRPAPPSATLTRRGDSLEIGWTHENPAEVFRWVVYRRYAGRWDYTISSRLERTARIPVSRLSAQRVEPADSTSPYRVDFCLEYGVTAVNRTGNESILRTFAVPHPGTSTR